MMRDGDALKLVKGRLDSRGPFVVGRHLFHDLFAERLQESQHVVRQRTHFDVGVFLDLLHGDGVTPGEFRHHVVVDRLADILDDGLQVGRQ